MAETQHIMQQAINLGTPKHTPRRAELKKQLGQSAAVFSAFRVHRQAEHLAGLLTDEHGHRRPFHQWAKEAQPYLNHQNRAWLQTEYNQAISRAHNEADWQRFKQDADLFPNLEWMPSTSITPGADHQPFWGTILPIDHPFWGEHRPGDRWGCKCQLRSTDAAPTAAPSGSALTAMRPAPGLGSAPGSGQLFSSDHPYYPTNCTACPYASITDKLRALASSKRPSCNKCKTLLKRIAKADRTENIKRHQADYQKLVDNPEYRDVVFNKLNGGLMATHVEHNFDKQRGHYETSAQKAGYHTGYKVILEKEDHTKAHKKNTDGTWNNKPMEIAASETATNNNIRDKLKHCARKPNCKVAVLLFPKNNFDLHTFRQGLNQYNGLKGTSQWVQFEQIICIQGNTIVHKISHQ